MMTDEDHVETCTNCGAEVTYDVGPGMYGKVYYIVCPNDGIVDANEEVYDDLWT